MIADDGALVRRSQQGDADAFEELVTRHRRIVFVIAKAIVLCPEEAEDVAQEAFLRAHRCIRQCNARREFVAWLRSITVNTAISALRRRAREGRPLSALLANGPSPTQRAPSAEVERDELKARVHEAIAALPLRQRMAITLFSLDGQSVEAAAVLLGCSVGTLKSHLFRAREKLAKALTGYVEEVGP